MTGHTGIITDRGGFFGQAPGLFKQAPRGDTASGKLGAFPTPIHTRGSLCSVPPNPVASTIRSPSRWRTWFRGITSTVTWKGSLT